MKKIISILKKAMPTTIAQDIISVQPMTAPLGRIFTVLDGRVGFSKFALANNQDECLKYPGEHYAVDIRPEVEQWLVEQGNYNWKYAEENDDLHIAFTRVIITAELYTWLIMRWS